MFLLLMMLLQGASALGQRLWGTAHYHMDTTAADGPVRAQARSAAPTSLAGSGHDHRVPQVEHHHDDHDHHQARLLHTGVPHHGGAVENDGSPPSGPGRGHAIGRHAHDRGDRGVVYLAVAVDSPDPAVPPPRSGFEAYWFVLPSPLRMAATSGLAAPPVTTTRAHASCTSLPPDRPPRS